MKFILIFFISLRYFFLFRAQLFERTPSQIGETYDRFEQINPQTPRKPNIHDLLLQAQNLVHTKSFQNILEPPQTSRSEIDDPPNFLAKNSNEPNEMMNKKNVDLVETKSDANKKIIIDGVKFEFEDLKEIVQFNKKLIKICKLDFSNCFDIKKSILPKRKVLSLLAGLEIGKESKKKHRESLGEINEMKIFNEVGNEIDQRIEDDLIDLGLK